jgi:hypothetical protein
LPVGGSVVEVVVRRQHEVDVKQSRADVTATLGASRSTEAVNAV